MRKLGYAVAVGLSVLFTGPLVSDRTHADEPGYHKARRYTAAHPRCREVWRCGPAGCGWKQVCWRGCYAALSTCYPLYGAYGPIGGVRYWGMYSWNVWDP
jgi:hypothetical protein